MTGNYTVAETFTVAGIGMGIVFVALGLLILLMILLTKSTAGRTALAAAAQAPAPPATVAATPADLVPAKGSYGEIKLYDVDDKTAALIMAIVADELQAPLNQLRFHSIRERKS